MVINNACTFSKIEIVHHYSNGNQSSVNALMLDASKTIERVHCCKLFAVLLNRGNLTLY